ncbi:MAG TPA: hypothetical protein VLF71_02580 [Candidatus Saccharimonadales bacterium]|nr:hypothetical protein [Candidatus Saccharimonadales bacterium]
MKHSRLLATATVALSVLLSLVTFLAPTPSGQWAAGFHIQFLEGVVTAVLFLGASAILLLGLRGFTPKFKLSYAAVCAGYSLISLSSLQIPLLTLVTPKITDLAWVSSGAIVLPFVVSSWLLFVGTRGFARLFGANGPATWRWLVLVISVAGAVLAVVLPHAAWDGQTERGFDGTVGGVTITMVPVIFAAIAAYRARSRASAEYAPFLGGIAFVSLCATLSPLFELLAAYVLHNGIEVITDGAMLVPLVAAGASLLYVAVQFSDQLAAGEQAVPEPDATPGADTGRLAIEAIVCVAQLASSPQAIDPLLDNMRVITTNLAPGQALTPGQQATLLAVYQKLEAYLATQEPIRRRAPQEIRTIVQHSLPPTLASSDFWRRLTQAPAA